MSAKTVAPIAVAVVLIVAAMVVVYVVTSAWPASARWITVVGILVAVTGISVAAVRRRIGTKQQQ